MLEPLEIEIPEKAILSLLHGGVVVVEGALKNMNIVLSVKKEEK